MTAPSLTANPGKLSGYERVTFTRRFFGDSFLEGILLVCTLGVGWLIWFAIVAPKGQSPAKSLLGVYILDYETGTIASTGQVWMRDFLGKLVIPFAISIVGLVALGQAGQNIGSLYNLIGGIMILASNENRALWDTIAGTHVVRFPFGIRQELPLQAPTMTSTSMRIAELESLREQGVITDVEYLQRRRDIINGPSQPT